MGLVKIIKYAINKMRSVSFGSKDTSESSYSEKMLPSLKKIVIDFLTYKPFGNDKQNSINQFLDNAEDFIDNKVDDYVGRAKKNIKNRAIKKASSGIIKASGNFIKFLVKALVKTVPILIQALPYILLIVLIIFFISLIPAFTNLFSFSYGFDKTAYYDTDLFEAVKNKEIMLENLYEKSSETSYYQRFADTTIDSLVEIIAAPEIGTEDLENINYKDKIEELQKEFTGFYSLDSRLTVHDANFKSTQDMIQANTVDSDLGEVSATVQGYLRDYFNKEVNFELSAQFLMQLNNKAFADYGLFEDLQLIYPEIFTKPVAYIDDFNRVEAIRTLNLDGMTYSYSWDEYTYVTQRIGLDDINRDSENLLLHFREKEWAQYYEGVPYQNKKITSDMQGKINSYPSPYVWEYIVIDKDSYGVHSNKVESNIIDNSYNSEYLLLIDDDTGEEVIAKFYYKILGYSKRPDNPKVDVSWKIDGVQDTSLGGNPDNYVFDGPYMSMENTVNGGVDISTKVKTTNDGLWYIVEIPNGYRLKNDISPELLTSNGLTLKQPRTIDEIKVSKNYNKKPKRHIQLVNLVGENGDIAVSSQSLINYKYYKFKTVSEAYRNKEDYINGWSDWMLEDENNNFISEYADKDFFSAIGSRIKAFGGGVWNAIRGVEQNLEMSDKKRDEAKTFHFIAEFPEDALNFSLYLYEKGLHSQYSEDEEIWKYDYSVNNYFKTDNENLDTKEYFQKYFYLAEELILARSVDGSGNVIWADTPFTKTVEMVIDDDALNVERDVFLNQIYKKLVVESDVNSIAGSYQRILEKTSLKMSTAYMNLGTVRKVNAKNGNFDKYIENGDIIGETFDGKNRLGEVSLIGTTYVNSSLRKDMNIHSSANSNVSEPKDDVEHTYYYLNAFSDVKTNIGNFFKGLFGGSKTPKEDLSADYTVTISAEEHEHLQDDYILVETRDMKINSSNVLEVGTGRELPLELKSVRDYGLGSVLNYVDSVVVEFKSGVSYEEIYLADEIGNQILKEFKDIYKTYSINDKDDSIEIISEGYYPKEVKDKGSDKLIELFAQNNKKAFFAEVVKAVDSKIFEVSAEYDAVYKDPDLNGYITSLGVSIADNKAIDNVDSIDISVDIINETYSSFPVKLELSGDNKSIKIKDYDKVKNVLNSSFIFTNEDDSTFDYYGPELTTINSNGLSQLLLPKRYYRSWLTQEGTENVSFLQKVKKWRAKEQDFKKSDIIPEKEDLVFGEYRGLKKYANSVFKMAEKNTAISDRWFQDEMDRKEKGHEAIASNNKEYSDYLLKKDSSNFVSGMSGEYNYIDEDELKRVYLIDEVVTFAGKFMYTYKDSLLSIGNSIDETTPKSILGAYATDRYVFLDSWDIKLLTERIVDVDFMIFSLEGKIDGQSIPDYISSQNNSVYSFISSFDLFDSLHKAADITKSTFVLAVPSRYSEDFENNYNLNRLFNNGFSGIESNKQPIKDSILSELEEYTQMIYKGFLFEKNKPSLYTTTGGESGTLVQAFDILSGHTYWEASDSEINKAKDRVRVAAEKKGIVNKNGYYSKSNIVNNSQSVQYFNEVKSEIHEEYMDDTWADTVIGTVEKVAEDFINGDFSNYKSSDDWNKYIDKNYLGGDTFFGDGYGKEELKENIENFYSGDLISELDQDEINALILEEYLRCQDYDIAMLSPEMAYEPAESYLSTGASHSGFLSGASAWFQEQLDKWANKITSNITGFKITSKYKVNSFKLNSFLTTRPIEAKDLKNLFNNYVKVLDETELYNTYGKNNSSKDYIPFEFKTKKGFGSFENAKSGTGTAYISQEIVRFTLKVSDEIALTEDFGRFYSQLSSNGIIGETINNTNIENPEIVNKYTFSTSDFGELIHVSANQIMSEDFLKIYNKKVSKNEQFTKEEWDKLWIPQLKIFDSLNESSYNQKSLKEYAYGVYNNDNFKNVEDVYKNGNLMLNIEERFQGDQTKRKFFFGKKITTSQYAFINNLTKKDSGDYLMGFNLEEPLASYDFMPNVYDRKEETVFNDKKAVINLYDTEQLIMPTLKINLNKFTETLNQIYKDKVKEIVTAGKYDLSTSAKKESYNITGFVMVPRLTDRRDEPTIYPLYKYFGGTTKKIEPSEMYKYFEGQTYDSWKNRMTLNEKSSTKDEEYFVNEKTRLSEYLESYLENFEANVPYNILADADLEVRGTAGYADLMTNYTLEPLYTKEYTNLFENEANKYYWKEFLDAYDITSRDLSQLLQGIVEHSIANAGEEALNLLVKTRETNGKLKYPNLDESRSENIAILQNAIVETISNRYAPLEVSLYNKPGSGNETEKYPLPIMGIAALDNYIDEPTTDIMDNSVPELAPFENFMFIGNFSDIFASIVKNNYKARTFVSQESTVEEFSNLFKDEIYNQENVEGIVIMLGINDILDLRNKNSIETNPLRVLIGKMRTTYPDANIYVHQVINVPDYGFFDEETNSYITSKELPKAFDSYLELNEVINTYNNKLKAGLSLYENVKVIDVSNAYMSETTGIEEDFAINDYYINDYDNVDGLNTRFIDYIRRGIYGQLFEKRDNSGGHVSPRHIGQKNTGYYSPKNSKTEPFEVVINLYENDNRDDRLNQEKAISYMGVKLYKLSRSMGDLLKGVYSYFNGQDFVRALIVVTDDNAKNLIDNPEHGLWYNPTANDIRLAIESLIGNSSNYEIPEDDDLIELFGVEKLKNSFSFIKNIENRKKMVTCSMNSGAGVFSGIQIGDAFGEVGANAKAVKKAAENNTVSGYSPIFDEYFTNINVLEYIFKVCAELSTEEIPLDPALIVGTLYQESGLNERAIQRNGSGRGIAQISNYTDKETGFSNKNGKKVKVKIKYENAMDGVNSIDYTIANLLGTIQGKSKNYEDGEHMHPLMAMRAHNLPAFITVRNKHTDEYPLTYAGDLAYIATYENGTTAGHELFKETMKYCYNNGASGAYRGMVSTLAEYQNIIENGGTLGYSDPRYSKNALRNYVEEYSKGDGILILDNKASNKRDYSEEIWEEQYMKYQNIGLFEYINHMDKNDIEDLISTTSIYRNNNEEQNYYGYTLLDFFNNIDKTSSSGENEFTGSLSDSLILNAMTYLGAHYSQGLISRPQDYIGGRLYSRISNAENISPRKVNGIGYDFTRWQYDSLFYVDGTSYQGDKFAVDCSSFVSLMYMAMGYEFKGGTTSTLRSGFAQLWPNTDITDEVNTLDNLKPGDIIINNKHAMIWVGDYSNNYKSLFNKDTLRVRNEQVLKYSGEEVLSWANANVEGKKSYIHSGGFIDGDSAVSIKPAYSNLLWKNDAKIYRIFRNDVDYDKASLETAGLPTPTIFTSTTIKNNPFLVEYMENAGILEYELTKGQFTMEDVYSAKNLISNIMGTTNTETE